MIIYVVSKYFHTANNATVNILLSRNAIIKIAFVASLKTHHSPSLHCVP